MRNLAFLILTILFLPLSPLVGKEAPNQLCNIRGYEIIFPYEKAINEIKNKFQNAPSIKEFELERFKKHFEQNFYGIPLYKEAGCSNARLSEYLNCLISTDDSDCRIYYSQMRIVDSIIKSSTFSSTFSCPSQLFRVTETKALLIGAELLITSPNLVPNEPKDIALIRVEKESSK